MGTTTAAADWPHPSLPTGHAQGITSELEARVPNDPQRLSLDEATPTTLIDNSRNLYIPIKLSCGVRVLCRPEVLRQCPLVIHDLNADLYECLKILPPSVHALVRRTQVWVNATYSYGPRRKPMVLNHSTAHHHEAWLLWARDRPDKTLSVEIYNCFDYRRMRLHWNGCGLLLHEISHLIHQQVLDNGLDNLNVIEAYRRAKDSERYENVLRRDWAGKGLDCDLAYAMVDHKEFFAEMSATYWSQGYTELDTEDRSDIHRCSPPLQEPNVLARIKPKQQQTSRPGTAGQVIGHDRNPLSYFRPAKDLARLLCSHDVNRGSHCNKFYPFTGGQLRSFDPTTYEAVDSLWREITEWNDTYHVPLCSKPPDCWSPWRRHQPANIMADTIEL